jgi:hypothetical protein
VSRRICRSAAKGATRLDDLGGSPGSCSSERSKRSAQSRNRVPGGRYADRSDGCSRATPWRDVMKVLVIASEPISADRLRAALGEGTDDTEIMVVAPALHRSALRFLLSDADEAIRRAELVQRETVEGLEDAGLDARGDTGEGDPVKAVEDVLVTFPAQRILIFTRPSSEERYDEGINADALQQQVGLPVQQVD